MKRHITAAVVEAIDNSQNLEVPAASIVPRITSADTADNYSVLDYTAPPHFAGPPLHWHEHTTEWYYVVAGTLAFALDDTTITLERGETVTILPHINHTFWNPTADPASLLMIVSPGGIEQYYAELAALAGAEAHGAARDHARLAALATRHDIQLSTDDPA